MTEAKPVVASKTAWWGTIMAIGGVTLGILESPGVKDAVSEHAPEAMVVMGVITVLLRFVTRGPIRLIGSALFR